MSNPDVGGRTTRSRDELFRTLADETRRDLLRLVADRSPAGIAKADLAFELAAVTNDKRLTAVTDDEYQRAQIDCYHRSLPALLETDLVAETDDGTIVATDHWAFDDPDVETVLRGEADASSADLDAIFGALADARRRTVLSVLADQYHPISVETLARDVAARAADTAERDVSQERVDEVRASLVHVHLPTLTNAGLVGYDTDSKRVSYEGHPVLRVSWLERDRATTTDDAGEPTDETASADADADVATLEGRETIVATGQSLCERAEDELFMLFTTTGLLEEGCFRRIEDALDRGVDVYLGSRDPRVRELVRERAPEVVCWEPQVDWLNLPPEGESVGRLVFADREAVMVGTIGSPNPQADDCTETAILGEGADNGFVVLMRQLLGPRLDRLDSRSEDVQSEIPL